MAAGKVPALKLTLGNAPNSWHVVDGMPGYYHPQIASPVGGIAEPGEELARRAAKDPGCPLALCHITPKQADDTRRLLETLRRDSQRALLAARRDGEPSPQHVHAERTALTGKE